MFGERLGQGFGEEAGLLDRGRICALTLREREGRRKKMGKQWEGEQVAG